MYRRTLTLGQDKLVLRCHFNDKDTAKEVPGWFWNKAHRTWDYPLQPDVLEQLQALFPNLEVDPSAVQRLKLVTEKMNAIAKAKADGWESAEPVKPMPIKATPFQHQVLGYNIALQLNHSAMLMEQGCGKTLTTLAAAGRRFLDGEINRVLVVAPASVVPVWPMEFEAYAGFPFQVAALDMRQVDKRIEFLMNWPADPNFLQVAVINYEATWRMEEALVRWKPDMIISDESQRIKTPSARQSKTMHRLAKRVKYRMILTGTPVTQNPLDFFSQYKFLDSGIFGNNYSIFRSRYAVMGGFEKRQVVGFKNLPELVQKAHSIAFRVTKEEALDLPEFTDQTLYCYLDPGAAKLYEQMAVESVMQLEAGTVTAQNVLTQLLRLSQLSGGFAGDADTGGAEQVSIAKFKLLKETVEDLFDAGKKVVIFARFIPEIKLIEEWLQSSSIDYGIIYGAIPKSERGEQVKKFQTDPKCRAFIAQIQTAGLGITLTAADTEIYYSLDFSFANYDQCRARIHRIGQKNTCTYIHLLTKGTVDEKIMKALKQKRDVATLVVDDWRSLFEMGE